jgi:prepilin-type N-terminal cleavage/methylation domain-containing protein
MRIHSTSRRADDQLQEGPIVKPKRRSSLVVGFNSTGRRTSAFTLVELLVVIAIIAMLVTLLKTLLIGEYARPFPNRLTQPVRRSGQARIRFKTWALRSGSSTREFRTTTSACG